jgi:hypothetical protein
LWNYIVICISLMIQGLTDGRTCSYIHNSGSKESFIMRYLTLRAQFTISLLWNTIVCTFCCFNWQFLCKTVVGKLACCHLNALEAFNTSSRNLQPKVVWRTWSKQNAYSTSQGW